LDLRIGVATAPIMKKFRRSSLPHEKAGASIMPSPKNDQIERFKKAVRELEADDDEIRFNAKLGKLIKQKQKSDDKSDD
jgi:hypothetical protein